MVHIRNSQSTVPPLCFSLTYRLFFLRSIAQIFYTNLHELFCQFISWTNWVNSGKFMDNCWISCQVMADMKKVYDNLIIVNLYVMGRWQKGSKLKHIITWCHHNYWWGREKQLFPFFIYIFFFSLSHLFHTVEKEIYRRKVQLQCRHIKLTTMGWNPS